MARGYCNWTFGWKEGERIAIFNERWRRLVAIHNEVAESLLAPLDNVRLAQRDTETLLRLAAEVGTWCQAIGSNIDDANGNHLRSYATVIKNLVLKAARLCREYGVSAVIPTDRGGVAASKSEFAYDARRKIITADGNDLYFRFSSQKVASNRRKSRCLCATIQRAGGEPLFAIRRSWTDVKGRAEGTE